MKSLSPETNSPTAIRFQDTSGGSVAIGFILSKSTGDGNSSPVYPNQKQRRWQLYSLQPLSPLTFGKAGHWLSTRANGTPWMKQEYGRLVRQFFGHMTDEKWNRSQFSDNESSRKQNSAWNFDIEGKFFLEWRYERVSNCARENLVHRRSKHSREKIQARARKGKNSPDVESSSTKEVWEGMSEILRSAYQLRIWSCGTSLRHLWINLVDDLR